MLFIIDLDYMQKLKLLADNSQSVSCIICLFNCLYIRFQTFRDDPRLWVVHALREGFGYKLFKTSPRRNTCLPVIGL